VYYESELKKLTAEKKNIVGIENETVTIA